MQKVINHISSCFLYPVNLSGVHRYYCLGANVYAFLKSYSRSDYIKILFTVSATFGSITAEKLNRFNPVYFNGSITLVILKRFTSSLVISLDTFYIIWYNTWCLNLEYILIIAYSTIYVKVAILCNLTNTTIYSTIYIIYWYFNTIYSV